MKSIKDNLFVLRSFRLLFLYQPWKLVFLFFLTLFLGLNQGFSIVLLIPFLQLLEIGETDSSNQLVKFFDLIVERTGINLSLEVVLLAYVVLLIIIALLTYWKSIYQSKYQENFSFQVRRRIFRKIILSDWNILNSKSKHNHLQVLTEEVPKLSNYYYFYLEMITRIIIVIAHIFFAFLISVRFTSLILVTGVVAFFFMRGFLLNAYHLGSKHVSTINRLIKHIDDFWLTVKIAKVHNTEDFYYRKFNDANADLMSLQFKLIKNHSLSQLLYRISGIFVLVAVVYIGYQVDKVPLSSFFILIILFGRILPQFISVNNFLNNIFSYIASVRLVLNLDEQFTDRNFQPKSKASEISLQKEIKILGIDFAYPGGEQLFCNFTETIPAKKLTGIAGRSGIGKTTLIDLIAGLQIPDKGTILIDDKALNNSNLSQWKSEIGYLPQDSFFIDGTIRENLVWDSQDNIRDEDILAVLELVNGRDIVTRHSQGLDTFLSNYQYYFSGGERQRLALARVLLRKPQMLILDEATSSLDSDNESQIMQVLADLKNKITILFITHRESVLPWFDKLIKIEENYVLKA